MVAPFSRVTTDLGGLTDELNQRFGRSFTPPDLQPEFVARAFELIDERAQRPPWEDRIGEFMSGLGALDDLARSRYLEFDPRPASVPLEHRAARPSSERELRKLELVERYNAPQWQSHRDRAGTTYQRFVAGA